MKRKWDKRLILDDLEGVQMRRRREADEELRLWKLSSCFFFLLSCALLWYSEVSKSREYARRCEIELDSPNLPLKQIRFTGGLKYNVDGNLYRDNSIEEETHAGAGGEVDSVWDLFETAQDMEFEHIYADDVSTSEHEKSATGLNVFYQLHCLNLIRKELNREAYPNIASAQDHKLRIDHCLDYVRQALMCHADTTPIKLYYGESSQTPTVDSEMVHTCRDFEALMDWSIHNGYGNPRLDLAHRAYER